MSAPSHSEAYISSLYFIFTSLTTVGFGNISPNTVAEKTFSIIVLMLGGMFFVQILLKSSSEASLITVIVVKLYKSKCCECLDLV